MFKWFSRQESKRSLQEIALVANFTSCPLGMSVHQSLGQKMFTLGMAHNGSQHGGFDGFPNEQADRERLIAYLKSKDMTVKHLVINQPFRLRPTVDDPLKADDEPKEESKVAELREKVRILVESPLFFVADLKQHDVFNGSVLLLQHSQVGMG